MHCYCSSPEAKTQSVVQEGASRDRFARTYTSKLLRILKCRTAVGTVATDGRGTGQSHGRIGVRLMLPLSGVPLTLSSSVLNKDTRGVTNQQALGGKLPRIFAS